MNPLLAPRRLSAGLALLTLLLHPPAPATAAEPSTGAPKAEGTWKWTFTMPDGTKASPRAKIKRDGNTLTGTSMVGAGTEVAITNGKVEGERVTWSVVREHGGRKVTTRYAGQLSEGWLRGTIESDWTGEKTTYPWEARRASDSPTGTWRWEINFGRPGGGGTTGTGAGGAGTGAAAGQGAAPGTRGPGGRGGGFRAEGRMTLQFEHGKLTGKVKGRTEDTEITNATFENGKIAFEVERERFGTTTITKYWGTLDGDSIKGKSEFEFGEELRKVDWEATRVEE